MAKADLSADALRDLQLIEKYRQGDKEAAEILFQNYKPLVISRARRYFLQGGEQEDLIQEAMIGLFQALERYDLSSDLPFSALAARLIQARLVDAVRTGARKKHQILSQSLSLQEKADDFDHSSQIYADQLLLQSENPEDQAIAKEELEAFKSFMQNKLSSFEAKTASMLGRGLSYQEVAALLEKDVKSIDNAVQRVRRKIKLLEMSKESS